MNTNVKLVIWSHRQVIGYIQQKSSIKLQMNCLPSGKLSSNKSKNKTVPSASQKYEQRIKAGKNRQNIQLISESDAILDKNLNDYLEYWQRKRTDIDNWRRDVISAMQHEMLERASSVNTYDSQLHPDSSTLTTSSTLFSVGEMCKRNLTSMKDLPVRYESNSKNIQKSPSIPLIRAKIPDTINHFQSPQLNQSFTNRKFNEPDYVMTDDDEVFISSNTSNNNRNISHYNEYAASSNKNSLFHYHNQSPPHKLNDQYCPKPVPISTYSPISNGRTSFEKYPERVYSPTRHQENNITKPSYQDLVSPTASNHQFNNESCYRNHYKTSDFKRNLHKNETNAKIILRNSNSSSNNTDQQFQVFQRVGSLNIKRFTVNNEQIGINNPIKINKIPERTISTKNIDVKSSYLNGTYKGRFDGCNNRQLLSIKSSPQKNQQQYVVLIPTSSQENISQFCDIQSRPIQFTKNNSLGNLTNVKRDFIPKVAINKPLSMRFAFSSQPNLFPAVDRPPMKIFS